MSVATDVGSIAIVGMGSGGHALAADLITRGFDVPVLVEKDEALREGLNRLRAIEMTGLLGTRRVAIPPVVADVRVAAACRWVMVVTTADAHPDVAASLAPSVTADQTVVLHTGYVAGSKLFVRALAAHGATRMPVVAETNTLLYSAYAYEAGRVHVSGLKRWIELAAPDPSVAAEVAERVRSLLEPVVAAPDALASSLNNPNPVTHVPILLLNFSIAETEWSGQGVVAPPGGFFHLGEYVTTAVARLQAALEAERIGVMRALGMSELIVPSGEFTRRCYPAGARESHPPRVGKTFVRRFYEEDIPCGLVPLESLAQRAGIDIPVTSSVITTMEQLLGTDFRRSARRVDAVG